MKKAKIFFRDFISPDTKNLLENTVLSDSERQRLEYDTPVSAIVTLDAGRTVSELKAALHSYWKVNEARVRMVKG